MVTDINAPKAAAWPNFDTSKADTEPDINPYEVDWKLSELPIEIRMEFQRRLDNGIAVITSIRRIAQDEVVTRNRELKDSGGGHLLAAALVCDLLGHYVGTVFYYVGLVPLAFFISVLFERIMSQRARQDRLLQVEEHLFDLKRQWLVNGFLAEDFDRAVNQMHKYLDFDDKDHDIFRQWWGRLLLEQICLMRNMASLPRLAQIPISWEIRD